MKVKATISYNGTKFYGSQVQENKITVNGTLQEVLKSMGVESKLEASGRTDRGVHATGQVVDFEIPEFWKDTKKLLETMNSKLPPSIQVRRIEIAGDDFHARYGASRRVYRYLLKEGRSNPFEDEFVTFVDQLNIEVLREAAKLFEGTHDFKEFHKRGSDNKTTVRTIYKTSVYRHKGVTVLYFEANGFLRSQIRLMVAMLLGINEGRFSLEDLKNRLECKKKTALKPAPSNGLYLAKIFYS
ncbi:tRNA pseudouridine(38-40) synthase TruA [Sulfurimonas sp. HSL-1716]|uniref:tRNA pseudouridine(38-40) synthase TruA n=1 Tax=Hydrocurvibacter sulfurireducens TaxID=3131937 RepID=UPI0031F8595C